MRLLWLSLKTGLVELRAHKTRSLLSLFSVAIGAGVFLSSFASIYDAQMRVRKGLALAGEGRFSLTPSYGNTGSEKDLKLSMGDFEAIRKAIPWLYMVYPRNNWGNRSTFEDGSEVNLYFNGITPEWRKRDWEYKLEGRFLDDYDVDNAMPVCLVVLPGAMRPEWKVLRKAFMRNRRRRTEQRFDDYAERNSVRIGSKIRSGNMVLTVVGLLYEPPAGESVHFGRGPGDVILPITTLNRMSGSGSTVSEIVIDTGRASTVEQAKRMAQVVLEGRHGPIKELSCEDYREALNVYLAQTMREALATLTLGLAALLAGGIGIMNVTLAIVFSRIKEIGIRRAIGATRGEIIMQFLTETLLLGFFGGLVGVALGYYGVGNIMLGDFTQTSKLTWWMPFLSVGVAMLACLVFSLLPAYRAAQLDPVEALRTE